MHPGFVFERVLRMEPSENKAVFLGHQKEQPHLKTILILEKNRLPPVDSQSSFESVYDQVVSSSPYHQNDIFSRQHLLMGHPSINSLDLCVIHPASDKLILKYSQVPKVVINESYEQYQSIWVPFLSRPEAQAETQWLHNIVQGQAEQEAVLYRDQHCIIIPNFDFQQSQDLRQLHLLAFPTQPDILSLRCLGPSHLPLLRNILKNGLQMVQTTYGLSPEQVKVCLHYQPTYYWLHVHFVAADHSSPSLDCLRSHLLSTVIQNIEMVGDYYQQVCLQYQLSTLHPLAQSLRP